ncbi:hypothetical protein D3C83_284950 [compost metagenome]
MTDRDRVDRDRLRVLADRDCASGKGVGALTHGDRIIGCRVGAKPGTLTAADSNRELAARARR